MKAPFAGVCTLPLLLILTAGAADAQLRLRSYASGLSAPLAIMQDPTDPTVQFAVEQGGKIRVVQSGVLGGTFLDLQALGLVGSGGERGLFSLAFPPDPAASGRFFVCYTNLAGNIVVARFTRSATNPLVADPDSRFELVWPGDTAFIPHPTNSNHNGGHMVFGPDGYLYIGVGDGGAGNDPPHNAQNPMRLLGKILRIDVDVDDADPRGYAVPADNPFAAGVLPGTSTPVLTEIWAFGVRNPWRFNFDDVARGGTGAMVMGDVGQGAWEEVNHEPAGAGGRNYGWRNREGKHATPGVPATPGLAYPATDPIHEYPHNGGGASITGGYVYRGAALGPAYVGRYFFADFVLARVWSIALVVDPATGEAQAADPREHTAELGGGGVIGNVSSFGVDASGELFVISYGGAIQRLALRGPPDLIVSGVTAPATGVAGRTISIPNTVRNVGEQPVSSPIRVDIYMSADSATAGAGTLVGSRNISSMAVGGVSTATTVVTVPPTATPGFYHVSAVVDGDDVVLESDEDNNGATAPTRVEVIRPDLAMLAVSGPARGVIGKPITVTTTVRNIGRAAAGPFTIGFHLSSTNTSISGPRLVARAVAGLGPNATSVLATPVTIPPGTPPGTYFLGAVADSDQTVAEMGDDADSTNGANNARTAAGPMQVVEFLPDLEITALSAPPTMGVARPLTVSFTARNSGPALAGPFRVSFFLAPVSTPPSAPGEGLNVGFKLLTGLGAGASVATTAVLQIPGNLSDNAYYLSAVADPGGEVAEVTEGAAANGRMAAAPIAVVRPELSITRFEASVPPAVARAARGGTLAVRNVTVRNNALAPGAAGPFTLKFYLSDDDTLDPLDVELAPAPRSPGLTPGASWATAPTLGIPATAGTGARFLIARVDALDEIFEANEDNTRAIPIEIGDFVDLQITAITGPAAAATGKQMTASFTVKNAGTAPAGPFRVSVFMAPGADPTPGAGTELASKQLTGLSTGASLASSVVFLVPADFTHGPYSLSAVADPDNRIPEPGGNESTTVNGRVAVRTIDVVRPDLQVFRITGPLRAGRGGTVTVTTTVRNAAVSPGTAPPSTLKFYLSGAALFDGGDLELPPARAIPALGPGGSSTLATTLLIPANVSAGASVIIARADALDAVIESDETNNAGVLSIEIGDFVDLAITAVSGPATVKVGLPMTVSATARNASAVPAGPFQVTFSMALPFGAGAVPGDGVVVGVKDVASLGPGASVGLTLVVTVPSDFVPGLYALSAVADAANAIPEAGGSDGAAANGRVMPRAITVLPPAPTRARLE